MTTRKILVVDDEPHNILLLRGLLSQLGHEVVGAENAIVALEVLDRSIDLILTDVMMPEMDGFSFVRELRQNPDYQDIPIVMVTTLGEKADRLAAVEAGANDFITKPVDLVELQVRVRSQLRQKAQQDEIKNFQQDLHNLVEQRTSELQNALNELDRAHVETIQHLSAAAEHKDDDTAHHLCRMSRYAALIAEKMGLPKKEVRLIQISSPMHDVGKIGIPDNILLKNGPLDGGEWDVMRTHAEKGSSILAKGASEYMRMGATIAETHHEKWDGSGYPRGLAGEDIPLVGRICAVADVFDALISKRPYKDPFPVEKALDIMREGRGTHFDPNVLDVFLENLDAVMEIKDQFREGLE